MSGDQLPVSARVAVARLVWLGYDTAADIVDLVCEQYADVGLSEQRVRDEVAQVLAKKAAEETGWPAEIDVERLDAVFAALADHHVLCLHDAGDTQEEGIAEMTAAWKEAGGESSSLEGYCLYLRPDLDHALAEKDLYLFFGVLPPMTASQSTDLTDHERRTLRIGRTVARCCGDAGFAVEWDGTTRKRIRIVEFDPRDRGLPEEDDAD